MKTALVRFQYRLIPPMTAICLLLPTLEVVCAVETESNSTLVSAQIVPHDDAANTGEVPWIDVGCSDACRCEACKNICCCTMEKVVEDKHCWKVNVEKVCVPPVCLPKCLRWPFQLCRSCAQCQVRCVKKLEQHSYECEECRCRWEVRCVPLCPGNCCSDLNCGCGARIESSGVGAVPLPEATGMIRTADQGHVLKAAASLNDESRSTETRTGIEPSPTTGKVRNPWRLHVPSPMGSSTRLSAQSPNVLFGE